MRRPVSGSSRKKTGGYEQMTTLVRTLRFRDLTLYIIGSVIGSGIFLTQYWHVWLRPGFGVGSKVSRGQVFANIADMGSRTHFHFAVFKGDFESHAWNGALPPASCSGFPAFPYRFIDPNTFLDARVAPVRLARGTRFV